MSVTNFCRSCSQHSVFSVSRRLISGLVLTCTTFHRWTRRLASRYKWESIRGLICADELQYIFICEFLYVSCTAVTKLSIGVYFLRLASKRYQIWTIYTTITVVMVISTMYFFFLLLQCIPINYLWNQYEGGAGKCLHGDILANVTYAHAAMSALTDWAFGILPIFFVYRMMMNPRTKYSVILILSLGFL